MSCKPNAYFFFSLIIICPYVSVAANTWHESILTIINTVIQKHIYQPKSSNCAEIDILRIFNMDNRQAAIMS